MTDDGCRLHYDEEGSADGAVLFLHGALASGRAFRGQLAALRDARRVILLDQRGHGRSTHLGRELSWDTLTVDRLARDAALVAEATRARLVVGASLGGLVGARLAQARPDLVDGLALLSTPSKSDPKWRAYFAGTTPDELPPATQRLARLWHGEPYWRELCAAIFAHFADPPAEAFAARPHVPHALVMQATHDELLDASDAHDWGVRLGARVERPPGDHAFFADGRDGTRAANRALREFIQSSAP